MKKRILTSLATIALASTLVGGATFAYFNATAENTNNLFKAGTIKLGQTVNLATKNNIQPGSFGVDQITLANQDTTGVSTLNSNVTGTITITQDMDLAAAVSAKITVDGVQVDLSSYDTNSDGMVSYAEINNLPLNLGVFTGGTLETRVIEFKWDFVDTHVAQNDLQGKRFNVAAQFQAIQQ